MKFSILAIIVFLFLLFADIILLLFLTIVNMRRKKIIKQNHQAIGTVGDIIEKMGLRGNKYYESLISYQPVSGTAITSRKFSIARPKELVKGAQVILFYDPSKPEKYVLKEDTRLRSINRFLGATCILLFIGAVCALLLL